MEEDSDERSVKFESPDEVSDESSDDFEIFDNSSGVEVPQDGASKVFREELEEENKVVEVVNAIGAGKSSENLQQKLTYIKRATDAILMPSFRDLTLMFSDGAMFLVDGDSLILNVMGDATYDFNNGGQFLHLIYLIERRLQLFSRKGGSFQVVFFNIWSQIWAGDHTLLLARSAVLNHLRVNMSCTVHEFHNAWDERFSKLLERCKCSFLLMDFQMTSIYRRLFPKQNYIVQDLIFHLHILYSLVGLYLGCVDINGIELNVSTLNAFYCPPGAKLEFTKLKRSLHAILETVELRSKQNVVPPETLTFSLNLQDERRRDIRHIATIHAAAHILTGDSIEQIYEEWVQALLLYSALMDVLPLKYRVCTPAKVKQTSLFSNFLEQVHKIMNSVLLAVCFSNPDGMYNFETVSDLWHGNFFVYVVNYVAEHREVVVTNQTFCRYGILLQEVVTFAGRPLEKFHLTTEEATGQMLHAEHEDRGIGNAVSLPIQPLVPTCCKVTQEFCNDILPDEIQTELANIFISRNKNFREISHWHSPRPITDAYDHVKNNVSKPTNVFEQRMINKFSRYMALYGSSIEGKSLISKTIVSASDSEKSSKGKCKEAKKLSAKAKKIIEANRRGKEIKNEECDKVQLKTFEDRYKKLKQAGNYETALSEVRLLEGQLKTNLVSQIAHLHKMELLWCLWKDECRNNVVSDRDLNYAKKLFLMIRKFLQESESVGISNKNAEVVGKYLWQMGLEKVAQMWKLPEPSDTTNQKYFIGISWVDFQLLHLGPDMERELGGEPDSRVEGFVPDMWQRMLFDCIDNRKSALVVAPTSSGKTYASYYCMEKVLREGNDGVIVYVAPTKALVNQVAATVYARFKSKAMPPGKSVYGIFTRDYRTNALNSQILVTVPECLELLLLSPRRHNWVKLLRYVIFDEIHCLAGQAGGFSWECGLLLIQCPFLALSATVQDPLALQKWLQDMQNFKEHRDRTDGRIIPHSFYKVELVVHRDRHADLKKYVYCKDRQFRHVHPYAYLDCTDIRKIPSGITLSPDEVHQLYVAMRSVWLQDFELEQLDPEEFFSKHTRGFISRLKVRDYETELKNILERWTARDRSLLQSVVDQLKTDVPDVSNISEKTFICRNFIDFCESLKKKNLLPAIVFSYNRQLVNYMFEKITTHLQDKEESMITDAEDPCSEAWGSTSSDSKKLNEFGVSRRRSNRNNKYEPTLNLLHTGSFGSSGVKHVGFADDTTVKFIENRLIRKGGYKRSDLFPCGLRMGIGKHYGGMSSVERSAVEMLFRMRVLNLVFATGTLALGIHMPCKTVAVVGDSPYLNSLEFQQMSGRAGRRGFDTAGNVVFMGLNERKMSKLLTGELPKMVGNFPLTVTMVLRVLLMVSDITSEGRQSEETARNALSRALTMLNCCLAYQEIPELKDQMKHFFLFSTQLLMLQGLLDDEGNPQLLCGIVTHLHYHEPGNLALAFLLRCGALGEFCTEEDNGTISRETQMKLVLVLSYLFAPLKLHKRFESRSYVNSKVVLPPLPPEIREALEEYNADVSRIYDNYFRNLAKYCSEKMGEDNTLPMSGVRVHPKEAIDPSVEGPTTFEKYIEQNYEPRTICSAFAALSGHKDSELYSHSNTISNIRHQVFTDVKVVPILELDETYNGYAWDFYNHGVAAAMRRDNRLKEGDDFTFLLDFYLVLKAIETSLVELELSEISQGVLKTITIVKENFREKFMNAYHCNVGL